MQNKRKNIALSAIAIFMLGTSSYAGKIITDANLTNILVEENQQFGFGGWNFDNVDVRIVNIADFSTAIPGSEFDIATGIYTPMDVNMSFESDIKNATGTVMAHLHGKDWPVGEPAGIKIINGDTKTSHGKPENCIMTSSYQEYQINDDNTSGTAYLNAFAEGDMPKPVLCSSPWQTHKRYKINLLPTTIEGVEPGNWGKPVDLVFNLDPLDNNTTITRYQVLQKVNNYTGMRLDGIKIEVLDENGFVNNDLTLSLGEGEGDAGADIWDVGDMANMSHGLWGPYEENSGELRFDNGFFDYKRVYFNVDLTDNNHTISYIGDMLGGNYQELFGNWLPSIWEPTGIFYDEDHNPATDNILQAFLGLAPGFTERAWFKRSVVYDPSTPNVDPAYTWEKATDEDLATWSGDWYNQGPIEDVLNLGLNYIINVGLNANIGNTFTLRVTPHVDTNQTAPSSHTNPLDWKIATSNDFNNDNISDIVYRNVNSGQYMILYMNADGTSKSFKYGTFLPLSYTLEDSNDFNADGITDILWRNTDNGQYVIFYMNADGTRDSYKFGSLVDLKYTLEDSNDFNADGIADILWRDTTNGQYVIFYMKANGTRDSYKFGSLVDLKYTLEDSNDFNADGIADILWRDTTNGQYVIFYMNADGTRDSYKFGSLVDLKYTLEDSNDFNADGIADILWRDTTNGQYVIFYMNADGTRNSYKFGSLVPLYYTLEDSNDFDGDGITDILWRNINNGQYLIFYMNADGTRKSYTFGSII